MKDIGCAIGPISGGCFTAMVAPDGTLSGEPIRSGEGVVISDLDFTLIDRRKQVMDSRGHYNRPELLSNDRQHSNCARSGTRCAPQVRRRAGVERISHSGCLTRRSGRNRNGDDRDQSSQGE
jgi:hypothetical protein